MKIILEFDVETPDDINEFKVAINGQAAHFCLSEIRQKLFRPARKHGYSDKKINDLIKLCPETSEGYNAAVEIIGLLEEQFGEILQDHKVSEDGTY